MPNHGNWQLSHLQVSFVLSGKKNQGLKTLCIMNKQNDAGEKGFFWWVKRNEIIDYFIIGWAFGHSDLQTCPSESKSFSLFSLSLSQSMTLLWFFNHLNCFSHLLTLFHNLHCCWNSSGNCKIIWNFLSFHLLQFFMGIKTLLIGNSEWITFECRQQGSFEAVHFSFEWQFTCTILCQQCLEFAIDF